MCISLFLFWSLYKTNRFHVAVCLFSNRSQRTSKCGENISDKTSWFSTHFDVICDLLLNRRTATWNLFVKLNSNMSPRLSGRSSIFGFRIFFVLKSLLGIARKWSREKFAILPLKPRIHVWIRTWAIVYRQVAFYLWCLPPFMTSLLHYDYFEKHFNRPHPLAELLRSTICLLGCSTKSNLKCFCKRTVEHPLQDKGDSAD